MCERNGSCLTRKYWTRLERLSWDRCSGFVAGEEEFYNLDQELARDNHRKLGWAVPHGSPEPQGQEFSSLPDRQPGSVPSLPAGFPVCPGSSESAAGNPPVAGGNGNAPPDPGVLVQPAAQRATVHRSPTARLRKAGVVAMKLFYNRLWNKICLSICLPMAYYLMLIICDSGQEWGHLNILHWGRPVHWSLILD